MWTVLSESRAMHGRMTRMWNRLLWKKRFFAKIESSNVDFLLLLEWCVLFAYVDVHKIYILFSTRFLIMDSDPV